jgi:hypothetical protein
MERAISQRQYLLQPHVHMCISEDTAIFLDLENDSYYGLPPDQTKILALLLQGLPTSLAEVQDSAAFGIAVELESQGLLTQNANVGKTARQIHLPLVDRNLCTASDIRLQSTRTSDILRFTKAFIVAKNAMRPRHIGRAIRSLMLRKSNRTAANADPSVTRSRTANFHALRPFFYTAKDHCLLDALTCVQFLNSYDIFPTFAIGVRADPFLAHSWVQIEHCLLSGSPEYTRTFTPILVV